MPTLDSLADDGLFTMLKGEPGTRKSTAALSYPLPQFWVSTDRKMAALQLPAKKWGIDLKQVHYEDYTDWDMPRARLEKLKVDCPYKTLIVDSVTSIGDNMNLQTIKFKKNEGGGKRVGTIYVPGLEEYNAEASAFQDLIATLKDIQEYHRIHVILIAHVVGQRVSDDKNKLTHHSRVIITGGDKISGKIASRMREVYHFNVEADFNVDSGEGHYCLFTQHVGADYARTSLPLARKITFDNSPLFTTYVAPAMKKLKEEKPIISTFPEPSSQTKPVTFTQPKEGK